LADFWNEAIENWGFVSNIFAEVFGAIILGGLIAAGFKLWTDRQRRLPSSLAIHRLSAFGLHVIEQAAGAFGYGFPADRQDWSWGQAAEYVAPYLEPGKEGQDRRDQIDRAEWTWLARAIVREFDRLDGRLQNYQFIFEEQRQIFERYTLLDADIDAVRAALEVLGSPEHQATALPEALHRILPSRVFPCVISAILLVGLTQEMKIERISSDAEGIRATAAYVSYMEPKYQDYLRSLHANKLPTKKSKLEL
jgi:hypothetical protein